MENCPKSWVTSDNHQILCVFGLQMYLVLNANVWLCVCECVCVYRSVPSRCGALLIAVTGVCLSGEGSHLWPMAALFALLLSEHESCAATGTWRGHKHACTRTHTHAHTDDTLPHSEGSSAGVDVNEAESFSSYLWHILQAQWYTAAWVIRKHSRSLSCFIPNQFVCSGIQA